MLTQSELQRVWHYCPDEGRFTRLMTVGGTKIGDVANFLRHDGYIQIQISGKKYLAHRLAYLYMTGEWPKNQIDHIDWIRNNNRWANLRNATNSINQQNQRGSKLNNTSGHLGVSWNTRAGKWRAAIQLNGKTIYLGFFDDKHEASERYLSKKRELHEGCTI